MNQDVEFLRGLIPSSENLVVAFWNELEGKIPGGSLHCVRLFETERNSAEYYGE
ncbi:MAG: 6-pyruvoyl trahydropterin synthase family protein [Bacteroidota bacterium]